MSVPRKLIIWIVAAILALAVLITIVTRRQQVTPEKWSNFLAGDPRAGALTFQEKGCGQCHAILGSGPKIGPDLGLLGAAGSSMNGLATQMWNHAPRMWEQIKHSSVPFPQFTAEDMANLFAYLYVTCYDDESGNVTHGEVLFSEKGCIRCHSMAGKGGHVGPDLTEIGPVATPIFWAQTMWNHAPAMEAHMRDLNIPWPQFQGEEMSDLLTYVRQARGGSEMESELLPASPGCLSEPESRNALCTRSGMLHDGRQQLVEVLECQPPTEPRHDRRARADGAAGLLFTPRAAAFMSRPSAFA